VRRALPVALATAAALAACGEDDEPPKLLDTAPIERGIARGVEKDRPGTRVVEVTCPEDVELRKGATFTCRVRGSKRGQEAIATVTQVDDEGRVRYRVP
jgi:hypothetical protein